SFPSFQCASASVERTVALSSALASARARSSGGTASAGRRRASDSSARPGSVEGREGWEGPGAFPRLGRARSSTGGAGARLAGPHQGAAEAGEGVGDVRGAGVAELLLDGQRALVVGLGARVVAHLVQRDPQVVEGDGDVAVVPPARLLEGRGGVLVAAQGAV